MSISAVGGNSPVDLHQLLKLASQGKTTSPAVQDADKDGDTDAPGAKESSTERLDIQA